MDTKLVAPDQNAPQREFGIGDAKGRALTYTGEGCFAWAEIGTPVVTHL